MRLARKWHSYGLMHGVKEQTCVVCEHTAAAVREALEEAERTVKDVGGPRDARLTGMIVAAIATLRGAK